MTTPKEPVAVSACKICDQLGERISGNKPWSGEGELLPEPVKRLVPLHEYPGDNLEICPVCGTRYVLDVWNELFGDGWTEFYELRRLQV